MMPCPCPSGSWLLKPFFKFKKYVYNGKMTNGHFSIGQSWNFKFHKVRLLKFQSFNFDLRKNFLNLKKGFSNLEPEGQGPGIIMGVTRLLLLGPFYTMQMQFYVLFCTQLYNRKVKLAGKQWLPLILPIFYPSYKLMSFFNQKHYSEFSGIVI